MSSDSQEAKIHRKQIGFSCLMSFLYIIIGSNHQTKGGEEKI